MTGQAQVGGRPRSVTVAVVLMTVVALGHLVDAVAVLAGASAYPGRVREFLTASGFDSHAGDTLASLATPLPYVAAGVTAGAALVLLVIALSVRAGSFVGRIFAWLVVGVSLPVSVLLLAQAGTPALSGLLSVTASRTDASGTHLFVQRLPAAYPSAYGNLSAAFATAAMLALVVVVVLLAQPAANRYFRPFVEVTRAAVPREQWPVPAQPTGAVERAAGVVDRSAELSVLVRKHQRGELSDGEFAAARRRLLDGD